MKYVVHEIDIVEVHIVLCCIKIEECCIKLQINVS